METGERSLQPGTKPTWLTWTFRLYRTASDSRPLASSVAVSKALTAAAPTLTIGGTRVYYTTARPDSGCKASMQVPLSTTSGSTGTMLSFLSMILETGQTSLGICVE